MQLWRAPSLALGRYFRDFLQLGSWLYEQDLAAFGMEVGQALALVS